MSELPLDALIRGICDDDYSGLIIEGKPPTDELKNCWLDLYDEYIEKIQDDDGRYIAERVKQRNLMLTQIQVVESIVSYVEYLLSASIHMDLSGLADKLTVWIGMPVQLDWNDKDLSISQLEMCMGYARSWYSTAENIKTEIGLATTEAGLKKMDRDYFDNLIIAISMTMNFKVNRKETTAGEFVVMVRTMRKMQEDLKDFSKN